MDLYLGEHRLVQQHLKRSINHGDTAFEANKKLTWGVKDIESSVTSDYNSCDSKIVTQKTNFKPLNVDTIQYAYYDASKPVNNRNLTLLNEVEASRTAVRPHNTYLSDFALVDY
jgi:hypothetical protein